MGVAYGAPETVTAGATAVPRRGMCDGKRPWSTSPAGSADVRDCWAVTIGKSFNDDNRCVAADYNNGDVKMFEMHTMSLQLENHLRNGVCALQFDRKDIHMHKFLACEVEFKFTVFAARTQHTKWDSHPWRPKRTSPRSGAGRTFRRRCVQHTDLCVAVCMKLSGVCLYMQQTGLCIHLHIIYG